MADKEDFKNPEQEHLKKENQDDAKKAALVNDDKNVPSDAATQDLDPDPMTDEKMKEINDTSLGE